MNGQEKDDEIAIGIYTAQFWEYDSRIGRRWNTDPIVYPEQSPYACFNNDPVYYSDPSGLEGTNDGDDKKPRPGADSKDKKRTGAKSDYENADPKGKTDNGYDGENDWDSKQDGKNTIVKFNKRGTEIVGYYSFPTPDNNPDNTPTTVDNGSTTGGSSDNNITPAGANTTPQQTTTTNTTPTNTNSTGRRTGQTVIQVTTTTNTTTNNNTASQQQQACNPLNIPLTFQWEGGTAMPKGGTAAAYVQIVRACQNWQPCNRFIGITVRTPALQGQLWNGVNNNIIMQQRADFVKGIIQNTLMARPNRPVFLPDRLLFNQGAGFIQNVNVNAN